MGNKITQTIILVDSAMGNSEIISTTSGGNFKNVLVNSIAICMEDTTAKMKVTGSNTAEVLVYLDINLPLIHFSQPQRFSTLKVPLLTATTGWFYLA